MGLEGAKEASGKMFDWALGLPDRPEHPVAKKIARITACLAILGLVFCLWGVMNGGLLKGHLDLSSLANPTAFNLMGQPMFIGAASIGVALLLEEVIPEKHHRTAAKVLACSTVIFVALGGYYMMRFGLANSYWYPHGIQGVTSALANPYVVLGAMFLVPGTLYTLGNTLTILNRRQEYEIIEDSNKKREEEAKAQSKEQKRLELAKSQEEKRLESSKEEDYIQMQELSFEE